MNTLINATLNPFVGILRRSGLLTQDLDYHAVRASMVIIFLFFGYQKWPRRVSSLRSSFRRGGSLHPRAA
jgi:hypothetical protein